MPIVFRVDPDSVKTVAGNVSSGGEPELFAVPGALISLYSDAAATVPAAAYTNITGNTLCPVFSPVTLPGSSSPTPYTGPQGQFGFWLPVGTFYYTITVQGQVFGPYALTVAGTSGAPTSSTQIVVSTSYQFTQTPGGSLNGGGALNVITLSPVPMGVNATDANHFLYISGGAGTAEAVVIAGGTAIAGSASGTIIVACANAHTGAWTIRSASSAIQEAANANPSGSIYVPPGVWPVYATVNLLNVSVNGAGASETFIMSMFGNAKVFYVNGAGGYFPEISSLAFYTDASVSSLTSAYWYIYVYQATPFIHNAQFVGGGGHIMLDASGYSWITDIFEASHKIGIQVGNGIGHASATFISGVVASSAAPSAVWLLCRSGNVYVTHSESQLSDTTVPNTGFHIYIIPTGAGDQFAESQFTSLELDGGTGSSINVVPNGGTVFALNFSNIMCSGGNYPTHPAISVGDGALQIDFTNVQTGGLGGTNGTIVSLGATSGISFNGLVSAGVVTTNVTGIKLFGVVNGLSIRNSRIGYKSSGAVETNMTYAIDFGSTASTIVDLQNNRLQGNSASIVASPATVTTWKASGNAGMPAATATAGSTLAFPFMDDGQMLVLSGATGVGTVTQLRTGQFGYIQTASAVAFTAGATIGNSFTTAVGGLATFYFDGTLIWLK